MVDCDQAFANDPGLRISLVPRHCQPERGQCNDKEDRNGQQQHSSPYTTVSVSNRPGRSRQPADESLSANFGRMPVALKVPRTCPVSLIPCRSNLKISCMESVSPSIPEISETLTTLRVPSLRRAIWITAWIADANCWRTARSGIFRLAMETMVSTRPSASRGVL